MATISIVVGPQCVMEPASMFWAKTPELSRTRIVPSVRVGKAAFYFIFLFFWNPWVNKSNRVTSRLTCWGCPRPQNQSRGCGKWSVKTNKRNKRKIRILLLKKWGKWKERKEGNKMTLQVILIANPCWKRWVKVSRLYSSLFWKHISKKKRRGDCT